ncbi:oligosaccharide flippase family protein [Vibrio breoganii]|uniref:oligosaccharide flippase family protein n=1 Tax=Vibrio breoganii TaxID=553239 RepID=UPI000C83B71E|nr:oligosaccharide flippase family protein [Vibrio breoganii]PMK30206.1 hypothetical protein BCU03_10770 [Vibrio breoganii]
MSKLKEYKSVINNIISLFFLRGLDYLLPLVLLPYLIRTVGVENFGLLAFATSTVAFFRGIVSYGFELSGTQQVSIYRENPQKLDEIFSNILFVRLILAVVCLIPFFILIFSVKSIGQHKEIFYFTFLIVIGDALFPEWYFRGIEKMKVITFTRIIYKSVFVLSVIIFVVNKDDYYLVPIIDGVGAILSGIVALIIACKKFKIVLVKPTFKGGIFQLKNSWYIFISKMSVHFYSSINIFVLGIFTNNLIVGYYSLAYKIYSAIKGLFIPFNQALFPFLSRKYVKNKVSYTKFVSRFSVLYIITLSLFALITFNFSGEIVRLISGEEVKDVEQILNIFSIALVFSIGGFFSQLLVIKSESKKVAKITFSSMILNLILIFPSIYFCGAKGLALAYLLVQIVQSVLQLIYNREIYIKAQ